MRTYLTVRIVLCFVVAVILFAPLVANAQVPFGSFITFLTPVCQTPPAIWIKATGVPLMYTAGSLSFLFGPPRNPGQPLLGMFSGYIPCIIWVPCGFGVCPVKIGGGPFIIFHGSG